MQGVATTKIKNETSILSYIGIKPS
jgi:hypothetical protein